MSETKSEVSNNDILGDLFRGSKHSLKYIEKKTFKYDKNGVLLKKIPYTNNFDYYPVHIARFALGNLECYLEKKDKRYKKIFFDQVNWLFKNLVYKDDFAVWEHHYTLPYYKFNKIPWTHGLGQGLGMIVLLKAYQITEEKKYLDAVMKTLHSFNIDIDKEGVRFMDEEKNIWLEEYAIYPPPHVLNGFITILFCVNEIYRSTKDKNALELWNQGLKTVKKKLECYDAGYWSYYDLLRKVPSKENYHRMHVRQLKQLYKLTGFQLFKNKSVKWQSLYNKKINHLRVKAMRNIYFVKNYGFIGSIKRLNEINNYKKN